MNQKIRIICLLFIILFLIVNLFAQGREYNGPIDPAGDIAAIREGYMTGNRVFLLFNNRTQLSDWPRQEVSRWPNNYDGSKMVDGIALVIGAHVYLKNDSIPVTDPDEIANNENLKSLYFMETGYRESMDKNEVGDIQFGLYPVPGYFNVSGETPAMSNKPESWPSDGWPSTGYQKKWAGFWNGRFGKGVTYADLETYFVANDAQDLEYFGEKNETKYYPRPNVKIGDYNPDVTIQKGRPWGGAGIRIETRGFQWNNPQARDAIFFEYNVTNISDYDIPEAAFGYWVDNAIGYPDADDELAYFDKFLDMSYSWDIDGVGVGGLKTGTLGFAYLESPGLAYDNIDNDDDGLVDEKRDNSASKIVGPTDGIENLSKYLNYYDKEESDLKEHWDADEDQDWTDGQDLNNNGTYEIEEPGGDDVGLDGIGPGEIGYTGPDEGECNHKPDFLEGVGCEPNFNFTDINESDMVGLTSFRMFASGDREKLGWYFGDDKNMFNLFASNELVEFTGEVSNLIETFASGTFPLYKGRTERISMSMLHSYESLEGLNSSTHDAPVLFRLKEIVQLIYEADYRFAQPPEMPTLKAVAGDETVTLMWDEVADKLTRDPFLDQKNDFEGYKIYKATDKKLSDAEVITDGFGTPMFKKPIYQCDIKDDKTGFASFGAVNGMEYYLGEDTGIKHCFVDNNVENGRTYYYAIVAYDYGAENIGPGVAPSENNVIIELDEAENIVSVGKNVQVVTPHQKAAGYIPDNISNNNEQLLGTGKVSMKIMNPAKTQTGHNYEVTFNVDTIEYDQYCERLVYYCNSGFNVYDKNLGEIVYSEDPENYTMKNIITKEFESGTISPGLEYNVLNSEQPISTDIFKGLQLTINQEVEFAEFNKNQTNWITGNSPIKVLQTPKSILFPWEYEIVFTGDDTSYTTQLPSTGLRKVYDEYGEYIDNGLVDQSFNFYVINKNFKDSLGNYIKMDMVVQDMDTDGEFNILKDRVLVGDLSRNPRFIGTVRYMKWAGTIFIIDFTNLKDESELPKVNDVYKISYKRPFFETDTLRFKINSGKKLDKKQLKNDMDNIKVVPNPYVVSNMMESAVANRFLNQDRKLMFTHIPAHCKISIYTSAGILVDVINVNNPDNNGIVHWNLQTSENLELAAGMYIYHVESIETGEEKIGKFAIIK